VVRAALAACGLLAFGCGDDIGPPGGDRIDALEELVEAYEAGEISRDSFRAGIAGFPDDPELDLVLPRLVAFTTLLTARDEPYRITAGMEVDPAAILVVEEGAEIVIDDGVSVDVNGRMYAIGSEDATVVIRGADGARYDTWFLHGGPNQLVHVELEGGDKNLYVDHPFETHTLVEGARFDRWLSLAIGQLDSSNLHVLRSRFGYQTPEEDELAETVRTRNSGVIVIEECEFAHRRGYRDVLDLEQCVEGHWPVVLHNRFDGGEDDAVDLDGCSAFVIGNHIRDFRPAVLTVQEAGVNGGGVTGDRESSHPFIANNVIDSCFHGIGFKDGSSPIIVNNTIINSNVGITLYESAVGKPMPDGVVLNNVLVNNVGWLDDEPNDIVLNGRWWEQYNQVDEVQGTIDARYNITATLSEPFPGEGNLNDDPMLELADGMPVPAAGSPALDSALGELVFEGVPMEQALEFLATDVRGVPRARSGEAFVDLDRGAVER
jgi:parallel beta-helix repeat protein